MLKNKISAKRIILTSTIVDLIDIFVNFIVAIITGSVVMIAETIQGVADFFVDIFVLIGLITSKKRPSKKHPLGHGRALYIWVFFATIIMFLITSTLTFYFGLKRFITPTPLENLLIAYIILFIFIFTNGYSFSLSSKRLLEGRKIKKLIYCFKNSDLIETKIIVVSDFIGMIAATIGLFALLLYSYTGNMKFDGFGAMSIGIAIALLTLFLIGETKTLLLGKSASKGIERKIKEVVIKNKDIKKILILRTLNIGLGKVLVNLEINIKDNLTTGKIEKIIEKLEKDIKKKIPEVKQIHIELRSKKSKNN